MKSNVLWALFLLLTFLVTLPVSWGVLAKADFLYPVFYDAIDIDQHIKKYAPKNRKKKHGFESTSKATRVQLFNEIVEAIHNNGEGLDTLIYSSEYQSIKQSTLLFTNAEVIHLKDVAILINKLKPVAIVLVVSWLLTVIVLILRNASLPRVRQFAVSGGVIIALSILILLLGPEKIFNQLHVWIFPENHQWFFYYEDSLMSTMMKAPVIFAYIAGIWVLLSMLLTCLLLAALYRINAIQR